MSPFNLTARITLNHDEYTTFSRNDGSFIIYNVGPGIHQLDIQNAAFHFPQIKVQLLEESMTTPKCLEYAYPGATKNPVPYPLVLTPYAAFNYFEQRKGFSIFVILKNPMFLMMGFSALMMFFMPKMMENLEPEEKERMMQQMEMQKDPTKMLSSFFGGGDDQASTKGKKKNLKNQ
jgi:ER membrane protein complex subunit 7